MSDLITFFHQRLDELEETAARHRVSVLTALLLRDVEADRKLLAAYAEVSYMDTADPEPEYAHGRAVGLGEAVRIRAARFEDHPDYRADWKP